MPMFLGSKYLDKRNYIANMSFQVPSQFATLQEAINHLYNKIIGPDVEIVIERGTVLSENITIDHRLKGNVTIRASVTYQWEGVLYMVGAKPPIVNAPPDITVDSDVGVGIISLSNSGNDLVITCSTTNPTFSSSLIGNEVKIRDNSGSYHTLEIASVSGNTLTLDATCPTVGDLGSAFVIVPATELYGDALVGPAIDIENNAHLIKIRGLTIETGISNNIGMQLINCQVQMWNMLLTAVTNGLYLDTNVLMRRSLGVCVWNAQADGIACYNSSEIFGLFGILGSTADCSRISYNSQARFTYGGIGSIAAFANQDGFAVEVKSHAEASNCVALLNGGSGFKADESSQANLISCLADGNQNAGIYCAYGSRIQADSAIVKNNVTKGIQAYMASNISALGTQANMSGNTGGNYDPPISGVTGNLNSIIDFD